MMGLPLIWAGILSFIIIMYVVLDGFDLGVGILFPLANSTAQRDIMMSTIAPVWDGNETWLVFGAAGLYGAFPLAYSILLPTLYMPLLIMLAALIFRGVAFEFRFKAVRTRLLWSIAFAGGSTVAAFCQGVILGTFVLGYPTSIHHQIVATPFHWLSAFSVMTGCGVVVGYALLGSTWLIGKTAGELQQKMYHIAKIALLIVAVFMLLVSVWTPLAVPLIMERWFSFPNIVSLSPLPICTSFAFIATWYTLSKRIEHLPFYLAITLFVFAYLGFCISDAPYIVPHVITIWEASSPPSSQLFILIGTLILLPILMAYTIYAYRIFRGKVTSAEGHY